MSPPTPRRRAARLATRFIAALGLAALVGLPAMMGYIGWAGSRDRARPAGAALVLGLALDDGGQPRPGLISRVQRGIALYRRGLVPRLVLSGGVPQAGRTEAAVMYRIARAAGVPDRALIREPAARSTVENFACSVPLLQQLGVHRALVVTEPWHMPRALLIADRYPHPSFFAAPALKTPGWQRWPSRLAALLHESIAYVVQAVRMQTSSAPRCPALPPATPPGSREHHHHAR